METAQLDPQAQALLEQMNLMQAQAAAPTHVLSLEGVTRPVKPLPVMNLMLFTRKNILGY